MRIGFDAKRYFHNSTGLGNYSRTLINGMVKSFPENEYYLFAAKIPQSISSVAKLITKKTVLPFWRQFGITKQIEKEGIELYHGLSAELPYFKPTKTKYVVTIHDVIFMKYPQYYKSIDRLIYAHKIENAIKKADCIIATSQQTKRDIEQITGDNKNRIEVIYQDCDPAFYNTLSTEEVTKLTSRFNLPSKFLVLVSKFEQRKNHIRVLEALQILKEECLPVVMVGKPGNTSNEVSQFIEKYKLNVLLISDANKQELIAIYQKAYASIFPSEYEGFGIPVLESLACGKPVLTSKDSCMEEIAGSAGLYFNPSNPKEIAESMKAIQEQELHSQLCDNITDRLALFNNSVILEQHNQLYKSLVC